GNLVRGLDGPDGKILQLDELVQDVAGRGDGVAGEDQLLVGADGGADQAVGEGLVAGDLSVSAGRQGGPGDAVVDRQQLAGLAVVVAGLEGGDVGVAELRLAGELLLDPAQGRGEGALVEPVDDAEGEEVLAAVGVVGAEAEGGDGVAGVFGERHGDGAVAGQRGVLQGVGDLVGLAEVGGGEGVPVDDEDAAGLEVLEADLQGGGVHGDE